jgi:hypothetical protein
MFADRHYFQSRIELMKNELFEAQRQRLCGMELTLVWLGFSSACFLEFGNLRTGFHRNGRPHRFPTGKMSVFLSWSWRIEHSNRIVVGSWSDDDDWQPVFDQTTGSRVLDITHFGRLPEIEIELSNGFRLLSFMTVEEGPDWTISSLAPHGEKGHYLSWKDGAFTENP